MTFEEMQERIRTYNEQNNQAQQVYDQFSDDTDHPMGSFGMGLNGSKVSDYISPMNGALASPQFPGGMTNGVETIATQQARSNLGDGSMDFKTKMNIGLGIAQTGLNAYSAYQGNKLGRQYLNQTKQQFDENMAMQKSTMSGNLTQQYNTAAHPEMLAPDRNTYLAQYGLGTKTA